jgi:hypothetical protein
MSARRCATRREGGQALLLALLLLVVVAGGGLALVALGGRADDVARARTAADAAALAGAVDGRAVAEQVASANGARVVAFEQHGGEAQVTVRLADVEATARARDDRWVPQASGGGGASTTGLDPRLAAALARAEQLLGEPVPITSGWRSPADQQRLWDQRGSNPYPVAPPGTSKHEQGLAVDVPRAFVPRLRGVAAAAGLCFPLPTTDPVHFEICPGARR